MKMKLHIDTLFTSEICQLVPHQEKSFATKKELFQTWTSDRSSSVFSGYRMDRKEIALDEIQLVTEKLKANFDTLIVLGIGGSALGAQSLLNALQHRCDSTKKIVFVDNLDSIRFQQNLENLRLEKSAVLCISKSGGTLETIAPLASLLERFQKSGLQVSEHFYAVTDPESGALRKWAEESSIQTLPLPSTIGGRFSVFSAVGFIPLAFAGLSIESFQKGQDLYIEKSFSEQEERIFTLAHRLFELDKGGLHGHCLFSYSSNLSLLGNWYTQLWGESLGKKDSQQTAVGSFPMNAVGSTDQHSLLQYLSEGPNLITTCFLTVKNFGEEIQIPKYPDAFREKLSFSEGKNWSEIINAQSKATQASLIEKHKATYQIEIESQTEENLAELYTFWMDMVSILGVFYRINPFDQPGVERGKVILPGILNT